MQRALELARLEDLPPKQRLLVLVLANLADEAGTCWPSRTILADHTGLNPKAITAGVQSLVDLGFLAREKRTGRSSVLSFTSKVTTVSVRCCTRDPR
jgi:DNA-binding MarR family transcriptional regulator